MQQLTARILACTVCQAVLPFPPRPVFQAATDSKLLIIGQAPGLRVQQSGVPWDDRSGDILRAWLGVSKDQFYDSHQFALMPMGFCYPGTGSTGDLPPRPECAPLWHESLLTRMPHLKLTLLIGRYAQQHYLKTASNASLTENVRNFQRFLPQYLPLVHPSPRNAIWLKKNPWFGTDVVPKLQDLVRQALV